MHEIVQKWTTKSPPLEKLLQEFKDTGEDPKSLMVVSHDAPVLHPKDIQEKKAFAEQQQ